MSQIVQFYIELSLVFIIVVCYTSSRCSTGLFRRFYRISVIVSVVDDIRPMSECTAHLLTRFLGTLKAKMYKIFAATHAVCIVVITTLATTGTSDATTTGQCHTM